jgi:hypothetical protein
LSALPDPGASIAPPSALVADCGGTQPTAACDGVALGAINSARASEGLGPLPLPGNFGALDLATQLIVVTNAERTTRGLPAMVANGVLGQLASLGAQIGADPTGPAGFAWGSNISWGYSSPLAADFAWMYDDGPGGNNIGCSGGGGGGCWDHRNNMLAPWAGAIGAAAYNAGGSMRLTALLVDGF